VHLLDGGLADNIGLRAVMTAYDRSGGFIGPRVRAGHVKRFVILVVNARTDPPEHLTARERSPGLVSVLDKTTTIATENYSTDSIELVRRLDQEREQAERNIARCNERLAACPSVERFPPLAGSLRTCLVEVNFEAIEPAERRREFLSVPTTFSLPPGQVQALVQMGGELLDRSPRFQRLLRALRGEPALGRGIGERGNCA
jgi:NTE family protein